MLLLKNTTYSWAWFTCLFIISNMVIYYKLTIFCLIGFTLSLLACGSTSQIQMTWNFSFSAHLRCCMMFLLWSFVSCLYAFDPFFSLKTWGKFLALLLLGLICHHQLKHIAYQHIRVMQKIVPIVFMLSLVAMLVEIKLNSPVLRTICGIIQWIAPHFRYRILYKPNALMLGIVMWPILWHMWRSSYKMTALIAVSNIFYACIISRHQTALIAFFVGFCFFLIAFYWQKATFLSLQYIPSMLLLTTPLWAKYALICHNFWALIPNHSFHVRLEMWRLVLDKIYDRWLCGWGIGASRSLPWCLEKVYYCSDYATPCGSYIKRIPGHPHNNILQLWFELGFIGTVCFSLLWVLCVRHVYHKTHRLDAWPYAGAMFTSVFVAAQASYSLWDFWWTAWVILSTCVAIICFYPFSEHKNLVCE